MPAIDPVSTSTGTIARRIASTDFRDPAFPFVFVAQDNGVVHSLRGGDRAIGGVRCA